MARPGRRLQLGQAGAAETDRRVEMGQKQPRGVGRTCVPQ